jgi:hypothetical protein
MAWEVQLTGDPTDLQTLADTFKGGEIQVAQSGNEYVLRSSQFEPLDSAASVREAAIELVTALSGSARLALGAREAIGVGPAVYRVGPDGKRDTTVLVGLAVSHERALPITVVHGTKIHRPADPISKWLPLATQDPVVAKALRLRNANDLDWVDLYRLYEVIENDVGCPMHQLGWASRNELERFARTANSVAAAGDKARHGVERTDPPRKPMSLSHARELIDRIMNAWLAWKASHHDEGSAT